MATQEEAEGPLQLGMGLLQLQHSGVLWARRHDTKCVVAWGEGTILVAFRGTCSMANVLADLQVWRAVHPPKRGSYWLGTTPMVQRGFLQCYTAEGLDSRVLQRMQSIVAGALLGSSGGGQPEEGVRWRIVLTGHSLGGALATLAALDLAQHFKAVEGCPPVTVSLYTFGAPRPGNHAFAHDFISKVPDSWDVIHSDDAVAREGKFLMLYKRAAHRVILTAQGDLIVRPSAMEASVRRGPAPSIAKHYLAAYGQTMVSIIRAQLRRHKGHGGGREAVQQLLQSQHMQALLRSKAGLRQDSLARIISEGSGEALEQETRRTMPRTTSSGGGGGGGGGGSRGESLDKLEKGEGSVGACKT